MENRIDPAVSGTKESETHISSREESSLPGVIPQTSDIPHSLTDTAPCSEKDRNFNESENTQHKIPSAAVSRRERRHLIIALICTVLATVGVIVYGTGAAWLIGKANTPLSVLMAREVFSSGITQLGNRLTLPPLPQIPPQTVPDGVTPGAAEAETIESIPDTESDGGMMLPIRSVDLSVPENDSFALINETPYRPDINSLRLSASPLPTTEELETEYGNGAPAVLILHTHGSEAYSPDGASEYNSSDSFRSYDPGESVVAVGRAIGAELTACGIGVIHTETMFDVEDYNTAYNRAADEIKRYLKKYPSISYIFDVHRDAMITSEGVNLRPVSESEGEATAQIMLVVGTDYAGSGHVTWEKNLSFALRIQEKVLAESSSLMRAINLRSASFNEQYTPQSLLIEIGTAANSLAEATRAGRLFARAVASIISGE